MGIEELERERAEQQRACRNPCAHDRYAFDRITPEAPVDRLPGAPRRARVDEERELGGRGRRLEEAEIPRAEQRDADLEGQGADTRADQPGELRACARAVGHPAPG